MELDGLLGADDPGDLADAVMQLFDELELRATQGGPDSLPPPVTTLHLALAADSAMNNEGPGELQRRSIGDDAVEALRALGADRRADLLAEALQAPSDPKWLDEWSLAGDLEVRVVEWVTRHAETFRAL